jgi:glycerol-3-phosphate cytidylyltransferase-like family protein/cytidine deaminase
VKAVVELRRYVAEWSAAQQDPFWQRKSGKAVLCVVICRSGNGTLESYRGMNTEVSLPAGSLCAERAAIARAASDFRPAATIAAIAAIDPTDKLNPLWPCEVCQSWLSKLKAQNPEIPVLAMQSTACENFAVRVNGELRPPPARSAPLSPEDLDNVTWQDLVELPSGAMEMPWEAKETVYVDGAWTFLHAAQQGVLRAARAKGTHLLVGVHSDGVLRREFDGPVLENFETRLGRVLNNRNVSSVLRGAPWCLTRDLIASLGIKRVITGSVDKTQDVGCLVNKDPYSVARELGILEVVPSLDETTEHSLRDQYAAHAAARSRI